MKRPPLLADPSAVFLREGDQTWTGSRLLRLAARIDAATPADAGPVVGLSSGSAAYVTAAALALWSRGRALLLLDPSLRQEPAAVLKQFPGLTVVCDAPRAALPRAVLVREEAGGEALTPAWPEEQELIALFLTSGSTGEPKLVRKRGFQVFDQVDQELDMLGVGSGVSVFSLAPPCHLLGFIYGLIMPLLGGGRTAFAPGELQGVWVERLQELQPELVVGVPMHYRLLARSQGGALPPAIYFSSGAPLPEAVQQAFLRRTGQEIFQGYGSTETGGVALRQGSGVWTPFPGLRWRVQPEDGRLAINSPWQQEPGRWHVTDDIAEPERGGFRLLGRADSVVKVAGKRFSTDEVERAARVLAGVEQATAVTYERFGETALALFVAPAEGAELDEATMRVGLGWALAPFKIPRTVLVLEQLPRLASGKVDRQQLRELCPSSSR